MHVEKIDISCGSLCLGRCIYLIFHTNFLGHESCFDRLGGLGEFSESAELPLSHAMNLVSTRALNSGDEHENKSAASGYFCRLGG